MIRLEITGETSEDFNANLFKTFRALLPAFAAMEPRRQEQPVDVTPKADEPQAEQQTTVDAAKANKPASRRGRQPKATAASDSNTPPAEGQQVDLEEAIADKQAEEPTIEEIRAALQALAKAKGDDACWQVMRDLGVKKASEAKEAGKGADLVAKCKEAMEEAE